MPISNQPLHLNEPKNITVPLSTQLTSTTSCILTSLVSSQYSLCWGTNIFVCYMTTNLPQKECDWQRTVCSGAKEEVPHDIPEQKGKHVTTTAYVDANQHHDQVTGRSDIACLHLVNATPSHWHTKRQATVETATFGSEFVAARIATDKIIDPRYTLMYLGVPIRSKSYLFGDNKSVVDSPHLPYPRTHVWLPIIESEKLQDTFNSTGRMENPILQTS